jgi:hypothetical protein
LQAAPCGRRAIGEHAHRNIVFPDAIDPAGQMVFGAEGGFQEPVDDFTVGERFLLSALTRRDRRDFGRNRLRPDHRIACDCRQSARGYREKSLHARNMYRVVARMERSEIRGTVVASSRISRSLSSGAHSRDPLAPSGLR